MFPSSGEEKETPTLLGSIERANNNHRTSFHYVIYSSYLEFGTMDKVHKPSHSECYTLVRTL
jgi:hypothetical protein